MVLSWGQDFAFHYIWLYSIYLECLCSFYYVCCYTGVACLDISPFRIFRNFFGVLVSFGLTLGTCSFNGNSFLRITLPLTGEG
jgi:hypothetical protein